MARRTLKALENQIAELRELREGDAQVIVNLNRRCAEHEVKGIERDRLVSELKTDKQNLWRVVFELSVAIRSRS